MVRFPAYDTIVLRLIRFPAGSAALPGVLLLRHRRLLGMLLGAAMALAGVGAVPAAAAAGTGGITFGAASSPAGQRGLISITAQAATPITTLTAHLISVSAGHPDVLDVSDFSLSAGSATDGTWTVLSPVTQAQLPLGRYTVKADAADSGGDSVTGALVSGMVDFRVFSAIIVSASPLTISYGNQDVTFSGKVTGLWPDGTTQPLGGQQVTIEDRSFPIGQAVTAAGGSYAVTLAVPALPASPRIFAIVPNASTMAGSASSVTISDTVDPVRVIAQFTDPAVNYGQAAVLTGTVTYQSGSQWKPLAGAEVSFTRLAPSVTSSPVTAVTSLAGAFSASLPDQDTNGAIWEALAGPVYPFLAQGSASASLTINFPTAFTSFTANSRPGKKIQPRGCLQVTKPGLDGPTSHVTIQYARRLHGPWAFLTSLQLTRSGSRSCHELRQSYFRGTTHAPSAARYYRAVFPSQPGYQTAVSKPSAGRSK
jgi:hypothetical protein